MGALGIDQAIKLAKNNHVEICFSTGYFPFLFYSLFLSFTL